MTSKYLKMLRDTKGQYLSKPFYSKCAQNQKPTFGDSTSVRDSQCRTKASQRKMVNVARSLVWMPSFDLEHRWAPDGLPQLQFDPLKIAYHLYSIEKRPKKGKVNEDPYLIDS